jgi:hypothetical protein
MAVRVDGGVKDGDGTSEGARRCEGRIWRCCRKFVVSRVRDGGVCTEVSRAMRLCMDQPA